MDILDTLKNRRSCRSFSTKEVEEDKFYFDNYINNI